MFKDDINKILTATIKFVKDSETFDHIHKKYSSLETCARILFMLLQDFFASARLHRVHKIYF